MGLREFMVAFDYHRINEYERIWRRNHKIPEDHPSTLFKDPTAKRKLAAI